MFALALALFTQDATPVPDGTRLAEGQTCYAMTIQRDGQAQPFGRTFQSVKRETVDSREVLRILVHQEVRGGTFRMRDTFVLDARTMLPLDFESQRNGKPHATLDWSADRITGTKHTSEGAPEPVDVPLESPVWEGDLWGLHFAALPLAEGARFTLPFWQYDKGFGVFSVEVKGSRSVETPSGPVDAWIVEASTEPARPTTYLISKSGNMELGYEGGPVTQMIGGDCSGMD